VGAEITKAGFDHKRTQTKIFATRIMTADFNHDPLTRFGRLLRLTLSVSTTACTKVTRAGFTEDR